MIPMRTSPLLALLALFALLAHATLAPASERTVLPIPDRTEPAVYVCPPCPHVDDLFHAERHHEPGTCPTCGMQRVELPVMAEQSPVLHPGSGAFAMKVGVVDSRRVSVFYYRPRDLAEDSPVLIVLPGAGRNAWDYRDHWIEAADAHRVLVLSLHYPEKEYPEFWSYNLAGMIADVEIDRKARALSGYRIVEDRDAWLFDDVEAVFAEVVQGTGLKTARYDLFGHSAGGQFLHRFALFARGNTRADRIVAANSGWYTVPDDRERFPYGLADAPITNEMLAAAFERRLVVMLGGDDDETENRGELVRNEQADRQGLHRLARGRYFHARASAKARKLGAPFNWSLHVVPNIGHDAKAISAAAATFLYANPAE
jgi:pimeloyl-ACP methyl ester carboxylesterase